MEKEVVYNAIQELLDEKMRGLTNQIKENKNNLAAESKSTAGDKHNTSRAMMHLEEEKISNQLLSLKKYKQVLVQINPKLLHKKVDLGSLVETNKGWLFIGIPLSWIEVEGNKVMCLSLASPIGQALKGKAPGDSVVFNQQKWEIISIA